MKRRIAVALALSLLGVIFAATPANAGTDNGKDYAQIYIVFNTIKFKACEAKLNVRKSDGRVQGVFYSADLSVLGLNSHNCLGWVESKRLGSGGYDWRKVSNFDGVDNSTAKTGWHWNGANVGSRVCISDQDGPDAICSTGVW